MRRLLMVLFGLTALAAVRLAAAEPSAEVNTEVRKLLELTGSSNMGMQIAKNMIAAMKPSLPGVPDEFWSGFEQEIKPDELTELVVPIYARNFTLEELRAANAFYSTPEGKSMVKKLPLIVNESMQVGQNWGRALAERVVARLKAKGLLKDEEAPAAGTTPPSSG